MATALQFHPLQPCLVRIFFGANSHKSVPCGMGVYLSNRQVLTCAHVVSSALGLPHEVFEKPTNSVRLDFPLICPELILNANIHFWDVETDLAILELQNPPPPGVEFASFVETSKVWGHKVQVFGFPKDYDKGTWANGELRGPNADRWIEIVDPLLTGYRFQLGFSGGPVWDETLQGCIGIFMAVEQNLALRTGYLIPASIIAEKWSELRVEHIFQRSRLKREVPPLLPFLVNRRAQDDYFTMAMRRYDSQKPLPVVSVVHGDDKQAHDMFLERIQRICIPKILNINTEYTPISSVHLPWPTHMRSVGELKEKLTQSFAEQILHTPMASCESIQGTLARYKSPVVVHTHLLTDDWIRYKGGVLSAYLDYWYNWPELAPRQYLFVFLFLTHKIPERGTLRKIRYSFQKRKIFSQLSNFSTQYFDHLVAFIFPELVNISRTEAEDWVRDHASEYCHGDLTDMISKIRELYGQLDLIPMEILAQKLKSYLIAYSD